MATIEREAWDSGTKDMDKSQSQKESIQQWKPLNIHYSENSMIKIHETCSAVRRNLQQTTMFAPNEKMRIKEPQLQSQSTLIYNNFQKR